MTNQGEAGAARGGPDAWYKVTPPAKKYAPALMPYLAVEIKGVTWQVIAPEWMIDRIIADHTTAALAVEALRVADEALYVMGKTLMSCAAALIPTQSDAVRAAARKAALTVEEEEGSAWRAAANRIEERARIEAARGEATR